MSEALSKRRRLLKHDGLLKMFTHHNLKVYRKALWFVASIESISIHWERAYRQLEKAATSLVLNIAEGHGRHSELDHRRFLDMAASSAVKAAAYLDICGQKNHFNAIDIAPGKQRLGRIGAMLSRF